MRVRVLCMLSIVVILGFSSEDSAFAKSNAAVLRIR